jgi:hypothetical protein
MASRTPTSTAGLDSCRQTRPGASQSSCRQARTGAAQALVDRRVQVQHKALVSRQVQVQPKARPGAAKSSCRLTRQVHHIGSCKMASPGAAQALVQDAIGQHLLAQHRLMLNIQVKPKQQQATDTLRDSTDSRRTDTQTRPGTAQTAAKDTFKGSTCYCRRDKPKGSRGCSRKQFYPSQT